jgi:predicted SAM-dependent methyltransferase
VRSQSKAMLEFSVRLFSLFRPRSRRTQWYFSKRINQIRADSPKKLNLGCGAHPIAGFVNIDLYSEMADERLDVLDLSTYKQESVDLIESHHLFEHLSFEDARRGLMEWRRILRPGGYLILTCPNITHVASIWIWRTLKFHLGLQVDRSYVEKMFYGPQTNPGMFHRAGYDHVSLKNLVVELGFDVQALHTPYPIRATPSMLLIAQRV